MEEDTLTKKEKRAVAKEQKKKERKKKDLFGKVKKIAVLGLVVAGVIFGGSKIINWFKTPVEIPEGATEVTESDWLKGNREAPVTLIEYSDFQCPACGAFVPIVERLLEEYPDNLKLVYRHFPLVQIHRNAIDAARAAEAAGKQGKFWEMYDKLFEMQDDWSEDGSPKDKFESYAEELELDKDKFEDDFKSKEVEDEVNNDLFMANRLRLNSTPTFFLNGVQLKEPRGYGDLKSLIDKEISRLPSD